MTEHERISIIDYVRERFDHQDATLKDVMTEITDLKDRVTALEDAHNADTGARAERGRIGRFVVAFITSLAALVGVLLEALATAHRRTPFTWLVDPKRANFDHYRRVSLVKS